MAAVLILLLILVPYTAAQPPAAAPTPTREDGGGAGLSPMTDVAALLLLKDSFANATALAAWSSSNPSSPCVWPGVVCIHGILTGINLGGMGLSGRINLDALAHFRGLRSIALISNRFDGPIPAFNRLHGLKALYLSHNLFEGPIPPDFFTHLRRLKKLYLDDNNFSGLIPQSLSNASRIIELHLEENQFTGQIPNLNLPALKSFNVSGNHLEGSVPAGLAKFQASAFAGNSELCGGPPVNKPCKVASLPSAAVVLSRPPPEEEKDWLTVRKMLVGIVLAMIAMAVLVASVMVARRWRPSEFDTLGIDNGNSTAAAMQAQASAREFSHSCSGSKLGGTSGGSGGGTSAAAAATGGGVTELVMLDEEKGVFGLQDLMKATAEVLGNGGLGSAYKAVMASSRSVVVKRLRDMNKLGRDAFDLELRRLGRLRHPNLLSPLAYHFRKEEKLIVLDYVPGGSLLYLLHGDQGPAHAALDWAARLKIVRGIARGMAYLHGELSAIDLPHGNLKSANVLLGDDFEPLLVDYGYYPMVNPSQASNALIAYKSPESLQYRRVSAKSDVYCLGIVILEVITGKLPSLYLNNTRGGTDVAQWAASAIAERREAELIDPDIAGEQHAVGQMKQLLRLGAACTEPNPDQRPDMREATARIEEIAAPEPARASSARSASLPMEEFEGVLAPARRSGSIG